MHEHVQRRFIKFSKTQLYAELWAVLKTWGCHFGFSTLGCVDQTHPIG